MSDLAMMTFNASAPALTAERLLEIEAEVRALMPPAIWCRPEVEADLRELIARNGVSDPDLRVLGRDKGMPRQGDIVHVRGEEFLRFGVMPTLPCAPAPRLGILSTLICNG